ncbi:MAG: hypothetical protein PUA61_05055 [Succinatimonas hippei]|nr:hypothetical protein [Succinatimonas hippei]
MADQKPETKIEQLHIRVTTAQLIELKARALKERTSLSDYVVGRALRGRPLEVLPKDAVMAMIRLRADVGRATGMMKHSIAQGVRDGPQIKEIERTYHEIAQQLYDLIKWISTILHKK